MDSYLSKTKRIIAARLGVWRWGSHWRILELLGELIVEFPQVGYIKHQGTSPYEIDDSDRKCQQPRMTLCDHIPKEITVNQFFRSGYGILTTVQA